MPRLTPLSGALIGAARGLSGMLQGQIQALQLQRQREQQLAEQELAKRDIAMRERTSGAQVRLIEAQTEELRRRNEQPDYEWEMRNMAFLHLRQGTATADEKRLLGLLAPATPRDLPTSLAGWATAHAAGVVTDAEFEQAKKDYRGLQAMTFQDSLFEYLLDRVPKSRKGKMITQQLGGIMQWEEVDIPIPLHEQTMIALKTWSMLSPRMSEFFLSLPEERDSFISEWMDDAIRLFGTDATGEIPIIDENGNVIPDAWAPGGALDQAGTTKEGTEANINAHMQQLQYLESQLQAVQRSMGTGSMSGAGETLPQTSESAEE